MQKSRPSKPNVFICNKYRVQLLGNRKRLWTTSTKFPCRLLKVNPKHIRFITVRQLETTLPSGLALQQLEPLPQGIRKSFRQSLDVVQQNVQRERVLVEVAVEHQLAVDVAGLSRLKDRGISFLVQNCQTQNAAPSNERTIPDRVGEGEKTKPLGSIITLTPRRKKSTASKQKTIYVTKLQKPS